MKMWVTLEVDDDLVGEEGEPIVFLRHASYGARVHQHKRKGKQQ